MSFTLTTDFVGEIGVTPRLVRLDSTDSIGTITTAGYLPNNSVLPTDVIFCNYAANGAAILSASVATTGIVTLSLSGIGAVDSVFGRQGAVVAVDGDYTKELITGLKTTSSPTFTNVNAGASGTAGYVASFPATASRGSLRMTAVANTGDTLTTISNAAMGQASVVSIPDPGAATASFVLNTGATTMAAGSKINLAKSTGTEAANAVTVNAQAGVITTSALTTAAGADYSITFTNSAIVAGSVILLSWMGGTNTVKAVTMSATAGAGTSTLVISNIDPADALDGTLIIGFAVL